MINDARSQIEQFFGVWEFTSHHPPFSTLILGVCYYLGYLVGNCNLGVAFRAKCKIFSRHLQKPILKTEKGRFKGL